MFDNKAENFIQANSPDGGFLQSNEWRKFQEAYGRKTFNVSSDSFWANIIEHKLKLIGNYFYVPRGPLGEGKIEDIIKVAKDNNAGWVRMDLLGGEASKLGLKVKKAPHDMQPKEIFVIDITKPEEQLLAEMKSKTRYNIKLAEKKGVNVYAITNSQETKDKQISNFKFQISNPFDEFLRLVKITARRNEISAHPEEYYRKMWEIIPSANLKLYIAEYQEKIIATNLVLFYGQFATYLHGASDNDFREVMAPYLLQWQVIQDAKKNGCAFYDFGGVSSGSTALDHSDLKRPDRYDSWKGITKFKLGFSPETKAIEFPGSYDIVINPWRYGTYRVMQKIKSLF